MRGVIIRTDGTASVEDIDTSLAGLQAIVGGYIEAVGLKCPHPATAYINEEGKLEGLMPNAAASQIAHLMPEDFIVGQMVVLGAPDDEGNDTAVSDEVLGWLGIDPAHFTIGAPTIHRAGAFDHPEYPDGVGVEDEDLAQEALREMGVTPPS